MRCVVVVVVLSCWLSAGVAQAEPTDDEPATLVLETMNGPFPSVSVWCEERRAESNGGAWACDPDSDGHLAGLKKPTAKPRAFVDARVVTIIETTKEARRETTSGQLYVAVKTARGWFFSTPVVVAISGEHNDFFLRVTRFETLRSSSALMVRVQHQNVATDGKEERNRDWAVWIGVGVSKVPSLLGPMLLAETQTGGASWEVTVQSNRAGLRWSARGTPPAATARLLHPTPLAFP